jgi:hypothetical protein
MRQEWHIGIRSLQQLLFFALLLGLLSMVCFRNDLWERPATEAALRVTYVKPEKVADNDSFLLKLLSIIEEVSEEEAEISPDDWTPCLNLSKTLQPDLFDHRVLSRYLSRYNRAYYRHWCSEKRMPIMAEATALYLYRYHNLKLPC